MASLVLMEKAVVPSILMGAIGSSVVMGKAQTSRVGTFQRSHPVKNWNCHNRHWVSGLIAAMVSLSLVLSSAKKEPSQQSCLRFATQTTVTSLQYPPTIISGTAMSAVHNHGTTS
jgi:hypothetical protein